MRTTDSGKHVLLTVQDVPFSLFPSYPQGGPPKVTATDWCVSYSTGTHIEGAVLSVHRWVGPNSPEGHSEKHPLNGTVHATVRDAECAAYEAGLTAFMVPTKKEGASA